MAGLPSWNTPLFGCLTRDNTNVESVLRTTLSASLPEPFVSRKADTSAPVNVTFGIDVSEAGWRAWQQWYTYDLADGVLSFYLYLPWGTLQPRVRARLIGAWHASRVAGLRWQVTGLMEIERWTLPRFSGGANA
jgi:hypothetical protein